MMNSFNRIHAALLTGALAALVTGCAGGDKTTPTVGERVAILSKIEGPTQVDPALANISVVLPPAQANAEWAQAGGSASKSYGHLALAASPSKVWTATVAGASNRVRLGAAPVTGGGKVYAVPTGPSMHSTRPPARPYGALLRRWPMICVLPHSAAG